MSYRGVRRGGLALRGNLKCLNLQKNLKIYQHTFTFLSVTRNVSIVISILSKTRVLNQNLFLC